MNVISLDGNMTKDVELRTNERGTVIGTFSLACNRNYKREGQQNTDFFNCVVFGKSAEILEKYTQKGSKLHVIGEMHIDNYEDKQGNKKTFPRIQVEKFQFLSGKQEQEQEQKQDNPYANPVRDSYKGLDTFRDGYDDLDITNDDLPF